MKQGLRIGVALSSGGIRGVYAHTGFMQALQEMGVHIEALTGCSAGAIVGGVVASGTSLGQWTKSLGRLNQKNFWNPYSLLKFLWSNIFHKGRGYMGLSSTESALRFTQKNLSVKTFEQCVIPFYSLAINLDSGEKKIFSSGDLAPRIVASAAVPVLYEPVVIDNHYYCDGALIEFAPTDAICCKHELDIVIVHHVSQHNTESGDVEKIKQKPWPLLEIVNRLLFRQRPWYLDKRPLDIRNCPCECGAIIMAFEPILPELQWPDVSDGNKTLNSAREQTLQYLSPYKKIMQANSKEMLHSLIQELESDKTP